MFLPMAASTRQGGVVNSYSEAYNQLVTVKHLLNLNLHANTKHPIRHQNFFKKCHQP